MVFYFPVRDMCERTCKLLMMMMSYDVFDYRQKAFGSVTTELEVEVLLRVTCIHIQFLL